jgi:hypothetical protein
MSKLAWRDMMVRRRSSHYGGRAEETWSKKPVVGALGLPVAVLAVVFLAVLVGCSSKPSALTSDPVAKVRLTRLLKFYRLYTNQHKKPPPNEQAFKEFIRSLPQDEKEAAGVGEDVDSFMVSPGDGQKYHIVYGMAARPDGPNQALAWEETGKDGKRYVALTMGYVQLYNEEDFQNFRKKK